MTKVLLQLSIGSMMILLTIAFGIQPLQPQLTFTSTTAATTTTAYHRNQRIIDNMKNPLFAVMMRSTSTTKRFVGAIDEFDFEPDDAALAELEEVVVQEEEDEEDDGLVQEVQEEIVQVNTEDDDVVVADLAEDEIVTKFEEVFEEDFDDEDYDDDDDDYYEDIEQGQLEDAEDDIYNTWVDIEDTSRDFELQDDQSDPNYTTQKQLMEANAARMATTETWDNFDIEDFTRKLTPEQLEQLKAIPSKDPQIAGMVLTEEDVAQVFDSHETFQAIMNSTSPLENDPWISDDVDDGNPLLRYAQLTNQDMIELQNSWNSLTDLDKIKDPNQILDEGMDCLEAYSNVTLHEVYETLIEIGPTGYNCTKYLLYDLKFNVSNLILAAIKHNPEAPILFQHWYPQIAVMERYKNICEDISWSQVEQANTTELELYYSGLGYDQIPTRTPMQTGIIEMDEFDEDEIRMVAFEKWFMDVYNPEWDTMDLDDEKFREEDNVFSESFEIPAHPDMPEFEDAQADIRDFNETLHEELQFRDVPTHELTDEEKEYRDSLGEEIFYTIDEDPEVQDMYRGHLIVSCTPEDSDLEIAEKITLAMEKNFGKKLIVETRVITHASLEDHVFEVWIESYEVELLHSKRRAFTKFKGWKGPMECDDAQVEYLVKRVGSMIGDGAIFHYKFEYSKEGV